MYKSEQWMRERVRENNKKNKYLERTKDRFVEWRHGSGNDRWRIGKKLLMLMLMLYMQHESMKELITEQKKNVAVIISLQYPEDIYHRHLKFMMFYLFSLLSIMKLKDEFYKDVLCNVFFLSFFLFQKYRNLSFFFLFIFLQENSLSVCV